MRDGIVNGKKGIWIKGEFREYEDRTTTIIPQPIKEQWFVYDYNDNFRYFDTEEAAHEEFLKVIAAYREDAEGEEWADEVEHIVWGKIYQTVRLKEIPDPNNEGLSPDDEDYCRPGKFDYYAEAFAIEHRGG